jgi:hypothetical protein
MQQRRRPSSSSKRRSRPHHRERLRPTSCHASQQIQRCGGRRLSPLAAPSGRPTTATPSSLWLVMPLAAAEGGENGGEGAGGARHRIPWAARRRRLQGRHLKFLLIPPFKKNAAQLFLHTDVNYLPPYLDKLKKPFQNRREYNRRNKISSA